MLLLRLPKFLALGFFMLFATNCVAQVSDCEKETDPKHSDEAQAEYDARLARIHAEIKELGEDHPWAATYYEGDGLGANLSFALAPESGCTFAWHGCLGLYDLNYGSVSIDDDGVLNLNLHFKNERYGFQGVATKLIPVQWSERRYLIPVEKIGEFCSSIHSRFGEPRDRIHGMYFLRRGDHKKKAEGLPTLPAKFRNHLITKPIRASITDVIDVNERDGIGGWRFRTSHVRIDAGTADRLLTGMVMEVVDSKALLPINVRITRTEAHTAEGEIVQSLVGAENCDSGPPQVGWKVVAGPRGAEADASKAAAGVFRDLAPAAAFERAAVEKKIVMMFFRADWCATCSVMDKRLWADAGIRAWLKDKCVAIRIDGTQKSSPEALRFKLTSVPTILFLDSGGDEIGRMDVALDSEQFLVDAEKILEKAKN